MSDIVERLLWAGDNESAYQRPLYRAAAAEIKRLRELFRIDGDVQVSNRLTDRLRGRYAVGLSIDGEPEFGWREFSPVPPIQLEAADEIERLMATIKRLEDECETLRGAAEVADEIRWRE